MIQNDENDYFHGSPISKVMVETTWAVEFLKNECKKDIYDCKNYSVLHDFFILNCFKDKNFEVSLQ